MTTPKMTTVNIYNKVNHENLLLSLLILNVHFCLPKNEPKRQPNIWSRVTGLPCATRKNQALRNSSAKANSNSRSLRHYMALLTFTLF